MDYVIMMVVGVLIGASIVVGIWWIEQKSGVKLVISCRKNMYWGTPITSSVADLARLEYLSSGNLQKMLDFVIASMSDEATMDIIRSNASSAGYGPALAEAGGMAKAANVFAESLENLRSGALVKKIAEEELKRSRMSQI